MRQISRAINYFFIAMSGASPSIVMSNNVGGNDRNFYVRLGVLVCLVGCFSGAAVAYMAYSFFNNIPLAVVAGIVWGGVIVIIDQSAVESIAKAKAKNLLIENQKGDQSKLSTEKGAKGSKKSSIFTILLGRIMITTFAASLVAASILAAIFSPAINKILFEQGNGAITALMVQGDTAQAIIGREIDKDRDLIAQYNELPLAVQQLANEKDSLSQLLANAQNELNIAARDRNRYSQASFGLSPYYTYRDSIAKIASPAQKQAILRYTSAIVRKSNEIKSLNATYIQKESNYNQQLSIHNAMRDSIVGVANARILQQQRKALGLSNSTDSLTRVAQPIYAENNFADKMRVYYDHVLKDPTNMRISAFWMLFIWAIELSVIFVKATAGVGAYEEEIAKKQQSAKEAMSKHRRSVDMRQAVAEKHYSLAFDENTQKFKGAAAAVYLERLDYEDSVSRAVGDLNLEANIAKVKMELEGFLKHMDEVDRLLQETKRKMNGKNNTGGIGDEKRDEVFDNLVDGVYGVLKKESQFFSEINKQTK